jgi:hypothetical protein
MPPSCGPRSGSFRSGLLFQTRFHYLWGCSNARSALARPIQYIARQIKKPSARIPHRDRIVVSQRRESLLQSNFPAHTCVAISVFLNSTNMRVVSDCQLMNMQVMSSGGMKFRQANQPSRIERCSRHWRRVETDGRPAHQPISKQQRPDLQHQCELIFISQPCTLRQCHGAFSRAHALLRSSLTRSWYAMTAILRVIIALLSRC